MRTLDLTDREAIQRPYPIYASTREELPVHWNPSLKGWFLSRHADVRSALMNADLSVEKMLGFGARELMTSEVEWRDELITRGLQSLPISFAART
jgi:cytochrome P450